MDRFDAFNSASPVIFIIYLAALVFYIYVFWKILEKAGLPGWGAIIPIYNIYLMVKLAKRPDWWLILFFIPFVNFIIMIIIALDIAKYFGKGTGFGLGLIFLGFIFYPVLAFGNAKYKKK